MKFTYETKPNERECVAYIDENNHLIIKESKNQRVFVLDGLFRAHKAVHRFYPGDSITITFE